MNLPPLSDEEVAAEIQAVPRVIENDADDDHVLACALAGQADLIVSGDRHLHGLEGTYQGILIITAAQALRRIGV